MNIIYWVSNTFNIAKYTEYERLDIYQFGYTCACELDDCVHIYLYRILLIPFYINYYRVIL